MLAANPGQSATVFVALASTAGTPVNNSTGKDTKLPPPATAFSVPAIAAAKNSRMVWAKCKLLFIRKREHLRSDSLAAEILRIGGDEVFGVGGPVTTRNTEIVGKGVYGGVLVHVRAQPDSRCRGALDSEDRLQALWVFSSDACGVYGIQGVSIAHAGRTVPVGEITLVADRQDLLVRAASAMLLRVIR